jgi:hypothetical protein
MKPANWTYSLLLMSALLLPVAGSCTDSLTSAPGGAGASRLAESAEGSLSQTAFTQGICGVIPATVVITENTRLTCDVVCVNATGPCIQFGSDHITLFLNGFRMTGAASPPTGCAANPGGVAPGNSGNFPFDGISTAGFDHVRIRGPGMVQTFRRHGIFMLESEKSIVENVTSHYNCYSGIFLGFSNDNLISENVSVRNGIASAGAPCGGNCITNSNANLIRRNHFYGNGSVVPGAVGPGLPLVPNDFGVGLVGSSTDNVIEDNSIGGNVNGILIVSTALQNLIRRNIIAGNPPVQLSLTFGTPVGVDIRDFSAGANTFVENHCITYEGVEVPAPCPNFSRSRGHY